MKAKVELTRESGGTGLRLTYIRDSMPRAGSSRRPRGCDLLVIRADGTTQTAATWISRTGSYYTQTGFSSWAPRTSRESRCAPSAARQSSN